MSVTVLDAISNNDNVNKLTLIGTRRVCRIAESTNQRLDETTKHAEANRGDRLSATTCIGNTRESSCELGSAVDKNENDHLIFRRVGVIYVFTETGAREEGREGGREEGTKRGREEGRVGTRRSKQRRRSKKVATFASGKSYEDFVTKVTLTSIKGRYARYNIHKSRPLLSHAIFMA